MWEPWVQIYLMIGTYNKRWVFGPAWSRRSKKFSWFFSSWTRQDEIENEFRQRQIFTREYVDDNYEPKYKGVQV